MTRLTPDADPRVLAGAIRAHCQSILDRDNLGKVIPGFPCVPPPETVPVAAALLAALDECEAEWSLGERRAYCEKADRIVIIIARALIERGVVLSEEE